MTALTFATSSSPRPAAVAWPPVLKVCGARTPEDVEVLAAGGADFVGLWHGIPGGHAELTLDELVHLAGVARDTGKLAPMLVTFISDVDRLRDVVKRAGIRWVQLHAYQPPGMIRELRSSISGELGIVKVIHMSRGKCLERPFLPAYERAGIDLFLLDKVTDDGRIGSTGQQLSGSEVMSVLPSFNRPFLLAGGISPHNRSDYESVATHPRFFGIDVDSAARDHHGRFEPATVWQLARGWGTAKGQEVSL